MNNTKKDFKYELTIGMIFKNDIKYIRNCLETMQPLRDAISCQLIMTDTGSTDGSRDVAEEYADILLDFQWCDDFSAARNTGTEIAEGRWFVYFDCDHEFDESILQIAEFLKTKESHTLEAASVNIRNCRQWGNKNNYSEQASFLLWSFERGITPFINPIHEGIEYQGGERTFLDVNLYHWGYADDTIQSKYDRNDLILETSIKNDPTNIHQQYQYVKGAKKPSAIIERSLAAIESCKEKYGQSRLMYCIYAACAEAALAVMRWDLVEEMQAKIKDISPNSLLDLQHLGIDINSAYLQNNHDTVLELYPKYTELYQQLQEKPDDIFTGLNLFSYFDSRNFHLLEHFYLKSAFTQDQDPELGPKLLEQSELYLYQEEENTTYYFKDYLNLVITNNQWHLLKKFYDYSFEKNHTEEVKNLQLTIEHCLKEEEKREPIFTALTENPVNAYTAMLKIRKMDFHPTAFTDDIIKFFHDEEDFHLNIQYIHLFYGYLKNGDDPTSFVAKHEVDTLMRAVATLFHLYPDLLEIIENRYNDPNFAITSLKEEKIWAYLGCRVPVLLAEEETPDVKRINAMFAKGTSMMSVLASKMYNPYLLSEEGRDVIPGEELFCVIATQAMEEKNPVNYVKKLKEALSFFPQYHKVLGLIIKEATKIDQNNQPSTQETKDQFSTLGDRKSVV